MVLPRIELGICPRQRHVLPLNYRTFFCNNIKLGFRIYPIAIRTVLIFQNV